MKSAIVIALLFAAAATLFYQDYRSTAEFASKCSALGVRDDSLTYVREGECWESKRGVLRTVEP